MRPDVEEFFCGISFDAYRLLGSHPAGPGRGWLFTLLCPARLPAWRSRITRSPRPCCAVPAGMLPF